MMYKDNKYTSLTITVTLIILGMLILFARNPSILTDPVVYAEDGRWIGLGLTEGWLDTLINARIDYFVFLNIIFLFLATKISFLISGNQLNLLAESIGLVSILYFSLVATLAFFVTRNLIPIFFRICLYLLILLIPLGETQNEIIGRVVQVGFYMPFVAVLLFYLRNTVITNNGKFLIDFVLLLCAATNPVIIMLTFLYLLQDLLKYFAIRKFINRNFTLIFPFALLVIFLIPRLGGAGSIPGGLVYASLIEMVIARTILYPFIYPWYSNLSDTYALALFFLWISCITTSYVLSKREIKQLIVYLLIALFTYDFITVIMRPGLTGFLSNYQSTFPDRYFMGINVLSTSLTVIAISQLAVSNRIFLKIIAYFAMTSIIVIYATNLPKIFELNGPKMQIKENVNFIDQVCSSKLLKGDSSTSVIDIYPSSWKMIVQSKFIDKSNCK